MNERILVLSNAAMSLSDSNGRTVAMLLKNYSAEQLAQFYTYGDPDFSICSRYYQVTDSQALRSFVKRTEEGGVPKNRLISSGGKMPGKKTPAKMLMRELIWKYGAWCKKRFWMWTDEFLPNIIFLNLGDNQFLPQLAMRLAEKYHIPIIVFSTEEYAFKNYNYITKKPSFFYWIFNKNLFNTYMILSKYVSKGYFNTPLLRDEYAKRYSYPCYVAMNSSNIDWVPNGKVSNKVKVAYLGNLGVNRHLPLIEIANAIAVVQPGLKLDVYGKIGSKKVKEELDNCQNINYCGFVSYDDVTRIIHESTLVVHAESQESFYIRDLKYAFSTKIADSISSGTPLLIYGDSSMAAMQFIKSEQCAFICTEKQDLVDVVRIALTDESSRSDIILNANKTRIKYFSDNGISL